MTHGEVGVQAGRGGRGRPNLPVFLVTQVDDLAARIHDRVVTPRSQALALAVTAPGVAEATLGQHATETRVTDHVAPRRRRTGAWTDVHHVLAAVGAEAADAVEGAKLPNWGRRR